MILWRHWLAVVEQLRPACSRMRTFLWLSVCLAGMCIRPDIFGVTSIVRAFGLKEAFYDRILDFFHSPALNLGELTRRWVNSVVTIFPGVPTKNGRLLIVGDGLKIPKSGKKMPGVKLLHQESDSNTKPEYIMGHSCQAVAILVGALQVSLPSLWQAVSMRGLSFPTGIRRLFWIRCFLWLTPSVFPRFILSPMRIIALARL